MNSHPLRILCVDDEPQMLESLALTLRRRAEVVTASGGDEALRLLARDPGFAVILSDMRMPGMDGASFLAKSRAVAPDAVRLLLTGDSTLESAIAAVNDGRIFRFLTKPCPPPVLVAAVTAAAEQHRLITAERVLLEQTLHGCILALSDALSLSNPFAFGRATRVKELCGELAEKLGSAGRWKVEVAAMLSQLGALSLPEETVERLYYGKPLSPQEQAMAARMPEIVEQMIGHIPRLEDIRAIIAGSARPVKEGLPQAIAPAAAEAALQAQILRLALAFDAAQGQGLAAGEALAKLGGEDQYEPRLLEALAALRGGPGEAAQVMDVLLSHLKVGMVFAEDVKMPSGTLLIARGFAVTPTFVERVRNLRPGAVCEPLRVLVRRAQ